MTPDLVWTTANTDALSINITDKASPLVKGGAEVRGGGIALIDRPKGDTINLDPNSHCEVPSGTVAISTKPKRLLSLRRRESFIRIIIIITVIARRLCRGDLNRIQKQSLRSPFRDCGNLNRFIIDWISISCPRIILLRCADADHDHLLTQVPLALGGLEAQLDLAG